MIGLAGDRADRNLHVPKLQLLSEELDPALGEPVTLAEAAKVLHRHLARHTLPDAAVEPLVFARPVVPRGRVHRTGRKRLRRVDHLMLRLRHAGA